MGGQKGRLTCSNNGVHNMLTSRHHLVDSAVLSCFAACLELSVPKSHVLTGVEARRSKHVFLTFLYHQRILHSVVGGFKLKEMVHTTDIVLSVAAIFFQSQFEKW